MKVIDCKDTYPVCRNPRCSNHGKNTDTYGYLTVSATHYIGIFFCDICNELIKLNKIERKNYLRGMSV